MSLFDTYLRLGYEHIVDVDGMDHILFLVALMAAYKPKSWLKIVLAASLFTLGHSLSLSLAALKVVDIDKDLIEFLIPATIVLTALFNLTKAGQQDNSTAKYWLAAAFGLIHGFGFANYYQMITLGETKYWSALLPFNLGVELGQLLIVAVILILMLIFQSVIKVKNQSWNLFLSGSAFGVALLMCIEKWPF